MTRRKNANLTISEARAKRALAAHHGYTQTRGQGAGVEGSALALDLAIIHGDVAVVSLDPDDRQALAAWLLEQAPPAHLAELIEGLAADLVYGLAVAETGEAPGPPTSGPINTMEG